MYDMRVVKTYKLYEIFNDYNRLSILLNLYDEELTVKEMMNRTNLSYPVVFHQLEFLVSKKVLGLNDDKYKIIDKTLNKLIKNMVNYVNK